MSPQIHTLAVWVYVVLALAGIGKGAGQGGTPPAGRSALPEADRAILASVADQYGLTGDARKLLFVIYRVERGVPGREMGILTPAAQRLKGDYAASLRLQAQYAAGTIKKRYTGDLAAFAARWCPTQGSLTETERRLNKNWLRNAQHWMKEK